MRRFVFAVCAFSFCIPTIARADVMYTYSGPAYTFTTGPYSSSNSLTGWFTVAEALTPNSVGSLVVPTAFSFSDGLQTLNDQTAGLRSANFTGFATDGMGQITAYDVDLMFKSGRINFERTRKSTFDQSSLGVVGAGYVGSSGTFTEVASTPEPASIALLGTGFLGVAGVLRRRALGPC